MQKTFRFYSIKLTATMNNSLCTRRNIPWRFTCDFSALIKTTRCDLFDGAVEGGCSRGQGGLGNSAKVSPFQGERYIKWQIYGTRRAQLRALAGLLVSGCCPWAQTPLVPLYTLSPPLLIPRKQSLLWPAARVVFI